MSLARFFVTEIPCPGEDEAEALLVLLGSSALSEVKLNNGWIVIINGNAPRLLEALI